MRIPLVSDTHPAMATTSSGKSINNIFMANVLSESEVGERKQRMVRAGDHVDDTELDAREVVSDIDKANLCARTLLGDVDASDLESAEKAIASVKNGNLQSTSRLADPVEEWRDLKSIELSSCDVAQNADVESIDINMLTHKEIEAETVNLMVRVRERQHRRNSKRRK